MNTIAAKSMNALTRVVVGTTLAFFALAANAIPIGAPGTEGQKVIVSGTDHVIATYQGNTASYSNDLRLNGNFIFNNHTTPVGASVDLGSFAIGTELIFELFVNNTGYSYFTGPDSRNPDGHAHARVQANWQPGETLVSFEDLFNGPFEFNDLSFSFTNTTSGPTDVPEPNPLLLMLVGIGLIGVTVRYRRA
ncbi:PEP-CTERM sorting domain-containing protein [Rhodanobacter sp. AS-Z3]|uniref:PEP-CTERM sorting domain-containing protein n=1 Tax=Rhodanobacter sp. AS-Z3 TaxID=3031330 RepID=UPI00247B2D59|nr:PEP-CTERM sorting domain-containing protein [Rhodanobacter sp. AS-Z3]WEN14271.1 PEP-CTERM sorting domain-containing protein [Rhodanobacter sp. AS-Z3]